jgi:MgsA AAA+ ATPase C terminal
MELWRECSLRTIVTRMERSDAYLVQPLQCDRWTSSSALQKAIRRGEVEMAQSAALALFGDDRPGAWRRMIGIAFEDVGAADADALIETVAACTSSDWRSQQGNERVLCYLSRRLAEAPKDRSADYLMWAASDHESLGQARETCRGASINGRLALLNGATPLPARAVAAWFCSGIDQPYQQRVGAGELAGRPGGATRSDRDSTWLA